MRILLTNDDGIHAPGLCALYRSLTLDHQVFVVAPDTERSAVGHAITLSDPLRARRVRGGGFDGWALSGTPADCVKIGLTKLVQSPIDLVVSGINLGANTGINILYSGTVSAATEAAILGCRSMAISLDSLKNGDFCYAASVAGELVQWLAGLSLPPGVFVNVNVPSTHPSRQKGVAIAPQSLTCYREEFDERMDPRGNTYYWMAGFRLCSGILEDSDVSMLSKGFITITPLHFDMTHHDTLKKIPLPRITSF